MRNGFRVLFIAAVGALAAACATPADTAGSPRKIEADDSVFVRPPPAPPVLGFNDDLVERRYAGPRGRRSFGEMRDREDCPKPETLNTIDDILDADAMGCTEAAQAAMERYMARDGAEKKSPGK